MKVLVDASVWSLALRRRAAARQPVIAELQALIDDGRVAIIGPIRSLTTDADFSRFAAVLPIRLHGRA